MALRQSEQKTRTDDSRLNPGQQDWDQTVDRKPPYTPSEDPYSQTSSKDWLKDEEENFVKQPLNNDSKILENNPDLYYRSQPPALPNLNGQGKKKNSLSNFFSSFKNSMGKKWLYVGVPSALITIATAFGVFVSGTFVSLKEMALDYFTGNHYNAYSRRVRKVILPEKFKEPSACKGILCRFKGGVSDAEIKKFEKAGWTVEVGENTHGKYIKSATVPDVDGQDIKVTADNFEEMYTKHPKIRGGAWALASPKALIYRAKFALKKYKFFNVVRSAKVLFTKASELRKHFMERFKGSGKKIPGAEEGEKDPNKEDPEKGVNDVNEDIDKQALEERNRIIDSNYEEGSRIRPNVDNLDGSLDTAPGVGQGVLTQAKNVGKSTLLGITAIIEKACAGYQAIRTVVIGAKIYKYAAFIAFAMTFMSNADAVKAGDASTGSVSFMAGWLSKPSTEQETLGYTAANSNLYSQVVDGKIQNRSALAYGVMGTAALTFLTATKKLFESFGANAANCKHVNKWYGQIVLAGVGVATTILSGGSLTVLGVAGSIAIGAGVSIIAQYITPLLIQYAAGLLIPDPDDPKGGFIVGEVIGAGLGAMASELGKGGLRPLKEEDSETIAQETNSEMAMINETERLGKSPLDPSVPNSVANRLALAVMPFAMAPMSQANIQNLASLITSPLTLIGNSMNQLFYNKVSAQSVDFGGQYCFDDIKATGAIVDANCNIVYGETDDLLTDSRYSPDNVMQYMIDRGHVGIEDGSVLSEEYGKFLRSCIDGNVPITADGKPIDITDDSTDTKLCLLTENNETYNGSSVSKETMFRRFIMDDNIYQGMKASAEGTLGM